MQWILIAVLVQFSGLLIAQDTTGAGAISGFVAGPDGKRAAGIEICIVSIASCTQTDSAGTFVFRSLRAGSYVLEARRQGKPSLSSSPIEVRAGFEDKVEIQLPELTAVNQTVTVTESAFLATEEIKNSAYLIQSKEIFKAAGALQDVSRFVQVLPGVVIGSNDLRNDLIVRGGSPLENLYIVDNIEIPNINAFANFASSGGVVGLLDAALIQDVTFLTGGYPSPFINRVSSVLQVTQREGSRENFQGRATVGFAGAGMILEGPIKKNKGSWVTSVRRSFLDLVTDDIGFGGVPVSYTLNSKALYDLNSSNRIWLINIAGRDSIRLGPTESPSDGSDDEENTLDIRENGWRNAIGFNWQKLYSPQTVGLLGVTQSFASVSSRVRDLFRAGLPGGGPGVDDRIALAPLVYRDDSRESETTLKYDLTSYLPALGKVQTGGSFKRFDMRYRSASPFGNDSPYSLTPDRNPFDFDRKISAYQPGAYLQATRNLRSRLSLSLGGRWDNYRYLGRNRFSPRAGVSVKLTERLSLRASYGQYFQQPFFLFVAAFPQNRGVIPFRADHYIGGLNYQVSSTLRFTVEAYRKNYRDYPVSSEFRQLSLANLGDTFAEREILFPLTSGGRGRVTGVEFLVEKKFSLNWYGQANVSFSRSRQAALDGVYRSSSFDYPRVINGLAGYQYGKWDFSARFAYLSGRPFTPFNLVESGRQRRAIFDLDAINSQRFPDYGRLDLRVDRTFSLRGKPFLVFGGAQNVLNRRNSGLLEWNRETNRQRTTEQLRLFPIAGLEWRF